MLLWHEEGSFWNSSRIVSWPVMAARLSPSSSATPSSCSIHVYSTIESRLLLLKSTVQLIGRIFVGLSWIRSDIFLNPKKDTFNGTIFLNHMPRAIASATPWFFARYPGMSLLQSSNQTFIESFHKAHVVHFFVPESKTLDIQIRVAPNSPNTREGNWVHKDT